MKATKLTFALVAVLIAGTGVIASADEEHPTIRAAHRYAHRKAVHASRAVYHAHAHYHNWKVRKGHKMRAWLNKH